MKYHLPVAIALTIVGIGLLFARSDREYINLPPTEGIPSGVIMNSDSEYAQTFTAKRPTITRIGIHIRPLKENPPDKPLTVTIAQNDQSIGQSTIPPSFIDSGDSTQVRFDPPLEVTENQPVTFTVSLPPELSGAVRLQTRQPDESFDPTFAEFTIDGKTQPNPIGYQVYFSHLPVLIIQLGLLAIVTGVILFFPTHFKLPAWILTAPAIALLPAAFTNPQHYWLYPVLILVLFLAHKHFNRHASTIPALFGAHIVTFTTWWPLQTWLLFNDESFSSIPGVAAHPKDIFLDPNQVPATDKFNGFYPELVEGWAHFGSYIGAIAALLALAGLFELIRRVRSKGLAKANEEIRSASDGLIIVLGIVATLIAILSPLTALSTWLPFPPQHLIIFATAFLAFFAAIGLESLKTYLRPSHLTSTIIFTIMVLSLIDLFQVLAHVLEFPL